MQTNEARKLNAYALGFAYRLGQLYAAGKFKLANDFFNEHKVKRNKFGEFTSTGGGTSTERSAEKQSFDDYLKDKPDLQKGSFRSQAKNYLIDTYRNDMVKSKYGLPDGKAVRFSARGLKETASYLKPDDKWILPRLKEVYENGRYQGCEKVRDGKHPDTKFFHLTAAILEHDGNKYLVQAKSKEKFNELELDHYYVALWNTKKPSR